VDICSATTTPFRLPLRLPLATAHGVTRIRQGALLCLRDRGGAKGYGETMPLPGFGLESLRAAQTALMWAAQALCQEAPQCLSEALVIAARCTPHTPGARAALETALHDLEARLRGVRLTTLLGGPRRNQVEVGALLAAKTPREVGEAAKQAVRQGFRTLKIKVAATSVDRDLARVSGARDAVGGDVALRLDANGGWDEATAHEALSRLAAAAPEYVEQPVAAADLDAMARLRASSPIPIAADEAAATPASARAVIAHRAADLLIVKPAVLGGPRRALTLAREARQVGIDSVVTGFLDSAIGDAAALHVAATLGGSARAAGLGTQALFLADLASGVAPTSGMRALPGAPGLGSVPDPARLARLASGQARRFARC